MGATEPHKKQNIVLFLGESNVCCWNPTALPHSLPLISLARHSDKWFCSSPSWCARFCSGPHHSVDWSGGARASSSLRQPSVSPSSKGSRLVAWFRRSGGPPASGTLWPVCALYANGPSMCSDASGHPRRHPLRAASWLRWLTDPNGCWLNTRASESWRSIDQTREHWSWLEGSSKVLARFLQGSQNEDFWGFVEDFWGLLRILKEFWGILRIFWGIWDVFLCFFGVPPALFFMHLACFLFRAP